MPKFVPSLKDLPEPPPEKQGWPWTEESNPLPPQMPDGSPWPRISIVTPSYNQGCFIEETIRSILLQGYPNLQYIIMDGGSTDETVEIIRKYEPWLDHWESKKDKGQADAINKGLELVNGEIFNWINSDDYLTRESLEVIAKCFQQKKADVVAGTCLNFWEGSNENGVILDVFNLDISYMIYNWRIKYFRSSSRKVRYRYHQPVVWLKTELVKQCGGIDEKLNYWFDGDLMLRYLALCPNAKVAYTPDTLANFRLQESSKTYQSITSGNKLFAEEKEKAIRKLHNLSDFQILHPYCDLYFRQRKWMETVNEFINNKSIPKWNKIINILFLLLKDPEVRLSRFTLGALLKS